MLAVIDVAGHVRGGAPVVGGKLTIIAVDLGVNLGQVDPLSGQVRVVIRFDAGRLPERIDGGRRRSSLLVLIVATGRKKERRDQNNDKK